MTNLKEHRGGPEGDLLLLVEIIVLFRAVEVLDIASESPGRSRCTAKILKTKHGFEHMSSNLREYVNKRYYSGETETHLENVVLAQELGGSISQQEPLFLGTVEGNRRGIGINRPL
jgi:hypothetical protein